MATPPPTQPETYINTACCALVQLQASNFTTAADLATRIKAMTAAGFRAMFVITLQEETKLVETLKGLKFEQVTTFNRRLAYPQTPLTMWIIRA